MEQLTLVSQTGWWDEGYDGTNGFAIGDRKKYSTDEEQDRVDSNSLYEMLETKIIPAYYNKENINTYSNEWITYMKNSIATNAGMYSTSRMLIDYLKRIYMPLIELNDSKFKSLEDVFEFLRWKKMCYEEWNKIKIYQDTQVNTEVLDAGENINVNIRVYLRKSTCRKC